MTATPISRPRRGRPLLAADAGRRIPLSVRITPAMRQRMVELAIANGRSLAQQTEIVLAWGLEAGERLERIEEKLAALLAVENGKNLAKLPRSNA